MALDPQFTSVPKVGYGYLSTASDNYDGTSSDAVTCFTAGSNGSFLGFLRIKPNGTSNSATVIRIFLNNGGAQATATNNHLINEIQVSSSTGNPTTSTMEATCQFGFAIPSGYKVLCLSAGDSTSGWHCTVIGGDF